MFWSDEGINVFLDISTYCNAGCPQCHRTDPKGLGKVDWLPLVQWSIDDFKKAFPLDVLNKISNYNFCGTWGDPIMVKDIIEIVEYIIENSTSYITINTNGSLRSEDFWWDLGVAGGKRLQLIFDVDGIDQEMHSYYRRFTDLDTVLNNMNTISKTNCRVKAQTVLFKHNQDYKDQITELVRNNGATSHTFVMSDRFYGTNGVTYHEDRDGNGFALEQGDSSVLSGGFIAGTNKKKLDDRIICRWAYPRNEVIVNHDGQILPCCYHQNSYYRSEITDEDWYLETNQVFKEYTENKLDYNVFHKSLIDIINSEWFRKTLPKSFSSDNPSRICEKNCSTRTEQKTHQLRENIIATG